MNFSTPERVYATIRAGDIAEWERATNRVNIQNMANCVPPMDDATAAKLNIKINVNWGELAVLLAHARLQYMTAFWSNAQFFKVSLPFAPSEHQSEWGGFITEQLGRIMKRSLAYFELHRSRWSQVTAFGPAPCQWTDCDRWRPRCVGIEDFRVPTDTTLDFENLGWFGIRKYYTPFELLKEAFDKKGNPRTGAWNVEVVKDILKTYKEINYDYAPNHYNWMTTPEKLAELIHQDNGYYASDAMPAIPLWHFYFQDLDENNNNSSAYWCKVVPETGYIKGSPAGQTFLWESKLPVAPSWNQIIHCQHGDLNTKAPFLYQSERSLGFVLLEPCFYSNITRNRMLQHLHDQFNVWLRVTDPPNKARPQIQEFGNYNVIQPGISVVPQQERHQVDNQLIEMVMGQLKQLQSEASASYTQQSDTGTKKEQTAFETSVKLQQVNALMSGLLSQALKYAEHEYREICRRFTLAKSNDPDVQEFQQRCTKFGIRAKWMDSKLWDIEPISPIGMGNPVLAQSNIQQLMQIRPQFDQTAQQEILHEAALIYTGDARKAGRWVPLGTGRGMTDSQRDAMSIFGTLMQGIPLPPREGLSYVEQVQTLMPLLAGVINRVEKGDNVGTPEEVAGFQAVEEYITTCLKQLATDENNAQFVKQQNDLLSQLMNIVKGFQQRQAEKAQQQQAQLDPAIQAKIQAMMMETQAKIQADMQAQQAEQKMKSQAEIRDQRRKDAAAMADIDRQNLKAASDRKNAKLTAEADAKNKKATARNGAD